MTYALDFSNDLTTAATALAIGVLAAEAVLFAALAIHKVILDGAVRRARIIRRLESGPPASRRRARRAD